MQAFPHHYRIVSSGRADGDVQLSGDDVPTLSITAPPAFGGPGGHWSPETLLVASVSTCFVLSFRSVARASKLAWQHLSCDVEGVLERVDGRNRFTRFTVKPTLVLGDEADADKAQRCLRKAEQVCLITNSLSAEIELQPAIESAAHS